MIKRLLLTLGIVTLCMAGESKAALVVTFNPVVAPSLGVNFTDFDVRVTNDAGTVSVNAMKFRVDLVGVGASLTVFDAPSTYRNTSNYIFAPDAPTRFSVASDGQFLTQLSSTSFQIHDSAALPAAVPSPNVNERVMVNNSSFLAARLRVNFASPISSPYSFSLSATALNGIGNEFGGLPVSGSYSGFGFGSNPGTGNTMVGLPFAQTQFNFITAVPEPSTFILLGVALGGAGLQKLRNRKKLLKPIGA